MKIKFKNSWLLLLLVALLSSCSKNPESIVSELYSSIYNGEWEKAIPFIIPDTIGDLNDNEVILLGEEFNRYSPKDRMVQSLMVDSASYNDEQNEIAYKITVNFNDSTSFSETGLLRKNAKGLWKLADYMPADNEKIPFDIDFDYPLEMMPNLRRAVVMVGAEKNIPKYQYHAAPYYLFAPYPVDKAKYVELLKKSSDAKFIPAMKELASRYNSYFFDSNNILFDEYVELTKEIASLGDLEAKAQVAWFQKAGSRGFAKDVAAAQKTFQEAYDAGIAEGAFGLGYMYGHGEGVEQDRAKALKYYKEAAEAGHLDAAYNVYFYYSNGWGTKRNQQEGIKIEQQYKDKAIGLDRSLYGNDQQKLLFQEYLLKIKNGETSGFYYERLGNSYELGKGVEQDIEKAKWCYRRDAALSSDFAKQDRIRMRGFENNPVIPMEEFKEIYK